MSTTPATFDLTAHGITVTTVHHNLPSSALYEHAILFEKASIAENGALIAYSGVKTGRSPKDKRVVEHPDSKSDIWWGPVNIPCDEHTFRVNRQRALDYLWHPSKYAELLAEKMRKHNARVWLVNTGWGGGGPGVGKRISLKNTRAIIDAIHDGSLAKAKTERDPVFGFEVAAECPGVPSEILIPRNAWANKATFEATAKKLAGLFNKNFETYAAGVNAEVKASAPKA